VYCRSPIFVNCTLVREMAIADFTSARRDSMLKTPIGT